MGIVEVLEISGGRSPLIIEDLDVYPQLPRPTGAPTLNSEEPLYHRVLSICRADLLFWSSPAEAPQGPILFAWVHERRWQAASVGLFWIGFEAFDVRSFGPSVDSAGGWGIGADRPAKTLVRLGSGFSYDCATGLQDGSGVTCIERAG